MLKKQLTETDSDMTDVLELTFKMFNYSHAPGRKGKYAQNEPIGIVSR